MRRIRYYFQRWFFFCLIDVSLTFNRPQLCQLNHIFRFHQWKTRWELYLLPRLLFLEQRLGILHLLRFQIFPNECGKFLSFIDEEALQLEFRLLLLSFINFSHPNLLLKFRSLWWVPVRSWHFWLVNFSFFLLKFFSLLTQLLEINSWLLFLLQLFFQLFGFFLF